jgi:hypothetical protein
MPSKTAAYVRLAVSHESARHNPGVGIMQSVFSPATRRRSPREKKMLNAAAVS